MKHKYISLVALSLSVLAPLNSMAQHPGVPAQKTEKLKTFKFVSADLETVLAMYCEWTGKTYLKTDAVTATITLKMDKATVPECVEAVEAILAMNNIAIVPVDFNEKLVKVVPANQTDPENKSILNSDIEHVSSDQIIRQLIQVNNVPAQQVQAAVQHLMHSYGSIQILEANNCIMVTDTVSTILRVRELIEFIDQAATQIVPKTYQIEYADASEIASKLEQIVAMAQAEQQASSSSSTARTTPSARTPAGVTRARSSRNTSATVAQTAARVSTIDGGSSIMIQGTVKIMADERTNLILIFSQEENFEFFDKIIKMLDIEVDPATIVEVVNLEYADAEEITSTLNELVGAAQSNSSSSSNARRTTQTANTANNTASNSQQNISKLSENAQILADVRSNSIILMGQKSDISVIKSVIAKLDIMLEQVVIEVAIFEIGLNDGLESGLQWLYQADDGNKVGGWNVNSLTTNTVAALTGAGSLNYYQYLTGINTKVAVNMAKTDSNAKLLSTPVIMTTDNTEAQLIIAEQRPVVTSTSTYANSSGTSSSNYQYKDIGIQLTVTPRISPGRLVVLEINQKADQIGGTSEIDGNPVPIILSREFDATVAVPDCGTIALGGLIQTEIADSHTKIPILGDIPLIGKLLFSSTSESEVQRELVVLLTPYVITSPQEMKAKTEQLYNNTSIVPTDWSWSESKLKNILKSID